MEAETEKAGALETCKIYLKASVQHGGRTWIALFHPLAAIMLGVAVPFAASGVLAGLARGTDVTWPLTMFAIAAFLGVVFNRIGFNATMRIQARTMSYLHQKLFNRLMERSVGFHADRVSGKLVSDAIDFVSSYGLLIASLFVNGLGFAVTILAGIVVLLVYSWQLGLFVTAIVAITLGWALAESRKRSHLRANRLIATKKLTAHLADCIVNAVTVKTFAREKFEQTRNAELNTVLEDLRKRDWQRAGVSGGNRIGALLLMQLLLLIFIVHMTRNNPALLTGGIFAFAYTLGLTSRLFEINNLTRQTEEALLNASPMVAMLRESVEITDKPAAKALKVRKGKIEVANVSFTYPEKTNGADVFNELNLTVAPGEKIGLVGPSGGGKSTLTRLLLRFDDIRGGNISVDGQNIAHVTQESLRHNVAYVPQEPLLFHRSIRENIAYGKPEATEKQIIGAAKKANAHNFITTLPKGYDTVVGERGVKLSGGQRQRIAIARAILKDAPILILDEATSALDSENELQVQGALWELMEGRTAIVIAHRLSTIQRMDRIIVLDQGEIIEEGTHKNLLGKKGMYAKLWKHQSGGFLEE